MPLHGDKARELEERLARLGIRAEDLEETFVHSGGKGGPKGGAPGPKGGGPKVDSKQESSLLPTAYVEAAVGDRFHLGLAAVPAFGLAIEWPADWVGREAAIKASASG